MAEGKPNVDGRPFKRYIIRVFQIRHFRLNYMTEPEEFRPDMKLYNKVGNNYSVFMYRWQAGRYVSTREEECGITRYRPSLDGNYRQLPSIYRLSQVINTIYM